MPDKGGRGSQLTKYIRLHSVPRSARWRLERHNEKWSSYRSFDTSRSGAALLGIRAVYGGVTGAVAASDFKNLNGRENGQLSTLSLFR